MDLRFGKFELDLDLPRLTRSGRSVELPGRALAVLACLAAHRERTVSRDELIEAVWGAGAVGEGSLDQAVKRARAALGDDGSRQAVIQTRRGRGYRFIATCRADEASEPRADPFVGRAALLERTEPIVAAGLRGKGGVLWIAGEAGIGKTRTAVELARRAERRGALAWFGCGVELGAAPPYWLWAQVLRRALSEGRTSPTRGLAALLREAMPELAPQLPGAEPARCRPGQPLDATQARFRLAAALVPALRAWAAEVPLVLVLDDLHRADLASLRLLEIVLPELADARIAWIGCHRDDSRTPGPAAECLATLTRVPGATTLSLDPLSRAEVGLLARELADREVSASLAEALHQRCGGNPFFLIQLLSMHGAQRPLERVVDAPVHELPGNVRAAIRSQVEELTEPTRALLALAAVAGRESEASVLATAVGRPLESVRRKLDAAVERGILRSDPDHPDVYAFAHGLVAEALAGALHDSERRPLHGALADALQARDHAPQRWAAIAEHRCRAAVPGQGLAAVEACRRAAGDARRRFALDDAIRWTRRALAILDSEPPQPTLRLALLQELGEASLLDGQPDAGREYLKEAFERARDLGRPEAAARAALAHAGLEEAPPLDEGRVAMLEQAHAGLAADDVGLRARILARLAMARLHDREPGPRFALAEEALAVSRRSEDEATRGYVLLCCRSSIWSPDNLERRLAVDREQLEVARRLGDPHLLHDAQSNLLCDLLEQGDITGVDHALAAHRRHARTAQQPYLMWYAEHYRVMRNLLDGDPAGAESRLFAAFERGRSWNPDLALQWFAVQLYGIRRAQGRLCELRSELETWVERSGVATWRAAAAFADLQAGDRDAAQRTLEMLLRSELAIPRDHSWLAGFSLLAELSAGLKHRDAAARVHRALLPHAGAHVVAGVAMLHLGPVTRFLGQTATALGAYDEAERFLALALDDDQRMGARSSELRTRLARHALWQARRAGARVLRGERERVRELAARAGLVGELEAADGWVTAA